MRKKKEHIQSPLVALGENSDWNTGTVELMTPIPMPETIRATMICARVYAVACNRAPIIMTTTPTAMVLRRPSRSPKVVVVIAPKKAPTLPERLSNHSLNVEKSRLTVVTSDYESLDHRSRHVERVESWSIDWNPLHHER